MRYHFYEGLNATETARLKRNRICEVYGPDALKRTYDPEWFARFRVENFNVKNVERLGRPRMMDTDKITTRLDANPHLTVRKIQEILGMSHGSFVAYLRDADYVSRINVWIPHELSDSLQQRLDACDLLLKKNKEHPFLKKMTQKVNRLQ